MSLKKLIYRSGHYLVVLVCLMLIFELLNDDLQFFNKLDQSSIIFGYAAFIFIAITLLIGPIGKFSPQKWKKSLLLFRRDAGISAGIFSLLHVVLVFISFEKGHSFMLLNDHTFSTGWEKLFFVIHHLDGTLQFRNDPLGVANYLGFTALFMIILMLFTSFDRAQKWLGGNLWKRIHTANVFVLLFVFFHAFIYIYNIKGYPFGIKYYALILGFVILIRGIGFLRDVIRKK
jgi:DMSO/TMAO reductase YedYZ heme-binding membrane subunit